MTLSEIAEAAVAELDRACFDGKFLRKIAAVTQAGEVFDGLRDGVICDCILEDLIYGAEHSPAYAATMVAVAEMLAGKELHVPGRLVRYLVAAARGEAKTVSTGASRWELEPRNSEVYHAVCFVLFEARMVKGLAVTMDDVFVAVGEALRKAELKPASASGVRAVYEAEERRKQQDDQARAARFAESEIQTQA